MQMGVSVKHQIITIEREYGSGGNAVGQQLSAELGIPCYGREILEKAAVKLSVSPEQIAHLEEGATSSVLYSVAMMAKMASGQSDGLSKESEIYLTEAAIMKELANKESCIIVGRCANWIFRERKDVLNVFIHADLEARKKRAIEEYGLDSDRIELILKKQDKRRASFYRANTAQIWDDKSSYHMILDSNKLGIPKCVELIKAAR